MKSRKSFFPIQNNITHHVLVFFKENETRKNFQIFDENYGLTPLQKWTLSHYVEMTFLKSRKFFFPIQNIIKHHVQVFFKENETQMNFQIVDETHGLTPLEKWTFSHYVKMTFVQSGNTFFLYGIQSNIIPRPFSKKINFGRSLTFLT